MRRNRNVPRGNGGGGNAPVRPFISDHLKDIDLELDLLKRKREMLERQQHIQPLMQQQQQRNFTQQPFYQLEPKQSGSNRDFSHLYNDGSQQFRKPFGNKKRQPDKDWQHNSYPKRSTGPGPRGSSFAGSTPARNQRPFASQSQQPKSTSFNYIQSKPSIGQKIANQKQQNPKPSKPLVNKVTKPTKAPPNKLASQPVGNRNQLVAAAMESMVQTEREALRLLPDKVPTKLMTGRLELALGVILRDVRDRCAESSHQELLRSPAIQRVIKQAIRERMRSAMLGKVVGPTPDTIKEYRAMYPKNTDVEIVNIALEAGGVKPDTDPKPIVVAKLRHDAFFRNSMLNLINGHLKEMFQKIEDVYKKENEMDTNDQEIVQEGEKVEEQAASGEDNASNVKAESAIDAENAEVANDGTKESDKAAENEEGDSAVKTEANSAASVEGTKNVEPMNGDNAATGAIDNTKEDPAGELLPHADLYKRMLPQCLRRSIPTILRLLNMNKLYARAVADITNTTRSQFVSYGKPDESGDTSQNAEGQPKKTPYNVLPYYVKVMGKPQLPKKNLMNTFLDVFHPKSIKKHRSIHNLLFIGFTEKSDYDAIVQADGTVIGRSTLSIRVCDKNTGKPGDNSQANSSTDQNASQPDNTKEDAKNTSASDLIGNELDSQISDLLTSVEQEDTENVEESAAQDDNQVNEGDEEVGETVDNVDEVFENIEADSGDVEQYDDGGDVEQNDDGGDVEQNDNGGEVEQNDNGAEVEQNGDGENVEDVTESQNNQDASVENTDQVSELKTSAGNKGTPSRASARLSNAPATPSSIRTRRSSRQIQN